jgi:hypothetical protein
VEEKIEDERGRGRSMRAVKNSPATPFEE